MTVSKTFPELFKFSRHTAHHAELIQLWSPKRDVYCRESRFCWSCYHAAYLDIKFPPKFASMLSSMWQSGRADVARKYEEQAVVSTLSDNMNQPAAALLTCSAKYPEVTRRDQSQTLKGSVLITPWWTQSVGYHLIKVLMAVYLFTLLCGCCNTVCSGRVQVFFERSGVFLKSCRTWSATGHNKQKDQAKCSRYDQLKKTLCANLFLLNLWVNICLGHH